MRPPLALLFNQRLLLLIAAFLILSAFLSTAAVARGGIQPSAFYAPQQQQSQQPEPQHQKTPVAEPTGVDHVATPIDTPVGAAVPQSTSVQQPPIPPQAEISTSTSSTSTTTKTTTTTTTSPAKAKPPPPPATVTPAKPPPSSPTSSSLPAAKPPVISVKPPPAAAPAPPKPPSPPPLPQEYKYFHESGISYELSHYDKRFFRGVIPYATHRTVLTHLVRSYLSTFRALHLETWLAHGTLLGWWWNGLTLPWDFDLDTQVSGETMRILGEQHNQSLHEYRWFNATSGKEETRVYLLDVNPFANRVDRGQGQNVIDARWIDVNTGMFVDITGLQERDPKNNPGVVSCKNFHGYKKEELWPLRETDFEGVPAMVPWEFEGILVAEYGAKSLVVTEWSDHIWNPDLKEWIKTPKKKTEKAEAVL